MRKLLFVCFLYVLSDCSIDCLRLNDRAEHKSATLSDTQISKLSNLTDFVNLERHFTNIAVERVVGTPGHDRVKDYIVKQLEKFGWAVERDTFKDATPTHGVLKFENIIARLNPEASRYLALACHYDSKYFPNQVFIGATDSAVPCSMMLNLIQVMDPLLKKIKNRKNLSLKLIFFDGEEAFKTWGPQDSIYGARHLAKKWHQTRDDLGLQIEQLDMMVLLDLLGTPDPVFHSYMRDTDQWYYELASAEKRLSRLKLLTRYSNGKPQQLYFRERSMRATVEDDHIPFWERGVPILHVIPVPFPEVWHTLGDTLAVIDRNTVENLNKIIRVFVARYLHVPVPN